MSENPTAGDAAPTRYEIRVKGHLESRWTAWFDGMALSTRPDGTTVISGLVADQAALHGLLQRLRDVGVPLISITDIPASSAASSIDSNGIEESS